MKRFLKSSVLGITAVALLSGTPTNAFMDKLVNTEKVIAIAKSVATGAGVGAGVGVGAAVQLGGGYFSCMALGAISGAFSGYKNATLKEEVLENRKEILENRQEIVAAQELIRENQALIIENGVMLQNLETWADSMDISVEELKDMIDENHLVLEALSEKSDTTYKELLAQNLTLNDIKKGVKIVEMKVDKGFGDVLEGQETIRKPWKGLLEEEDVVVSSNYYGYHFDDKEYDDQ